MSYSNIKNHATPGVESKPYEHMKISLWNLEYYGNAKTASMLEENIIAS